MPLSLTCTCGAKLEIDEKFAGKVITCPDCQKEISTAPEPVIAARTSGFAIASLLLSLLGPLTLVLPLAALATGFVALSHITRQPKEVGGRRFASTGIILGGLFSCLSLAGWFFPGLFPVDGVFREIEWAGKLDFSGRLTLEEDRDDPKFTIMVTRPNLSWGKASGLRGKDGGEDLLILINPWNDAQVTCVNMSYPHLGEEEPVILTRAGDHFLKSALVAFLMGPAAAERKDDKPPTYRDMKNTSADGKTSFEMLIDLHQPGPARTFLLRVIVDNSRMYIVAAGTRSAYFGRMEPQLRQMVSSFQVLHGT